MNENMAASIFVLPFLSFSFITYLNGGAAVLFDSQNPTGAAERTFCFSGGVAALTGSPLPFTTEQGGCLCTSLLHYLLIFSLTLAFLSNMYYYFFGGLLAALVLQALQNKCDASEGGAAAGFHGKYDPIFEKTKYYLCRALVIFRTLQNVFLQLMKQLRKSDAPHLIVWNISGQRSRTAEVSPVFWLDGGCSTSLSPSCELMCAYFCIYAG